ncbi:hypothetical protein ACLOJK_038853 [Asimina triloba]
MSALQPSPTTTCQPPPPPPPLPPAATCADHKLSIPSPASSSPPPPAAACADHKLSIPSPASSPDKVGVGVQRAEWLRAAILGAYDGLLSTTALMHGVRAASDKRWSVILSSFAGTIAGACYMAAGEFVSVATQRDIEKANRRQQQLKYSTDLPEAAASPTTTKIPASLATTPQKRKERGDGELLEVVADPYKAAIASGLSFVLGSAVPLLLAMLVVDGHVRNVVLPVGATMALALFGGLGAYLGGSPVTISALRVMMGGFLGMAITYGLMRLIKNCEDSYMYAQ